MATQRTTSTRRSNATRHAAKLRLAPYSSDLRWYWTLYKQSDHWLGDLRVDLEGLSDATRLQRTGLIESLLVENGFTGKTANGRVLPMNKKAWMRLKKYTVLAGVNEPKKSCHGVHKARSEVAAYANCTESQMMAMLGWTAPKMPAHYIAKANREKLGMSGMDKVVAFDQSQSLGDFLAIPDGNDAGTSTENRIVTVRSNFGKKLMISNLNLGLWCARSARNHSQKHCNY
jgi:hypothetical protein